MSGCDMAARVQDAPQGDTAAGKQLYLSTGYGGFGPDSDIPPLASVRH
jgi:hypothetical protein